MKWNRANKLKLFRLLDSKQHEYIVSNILMSNKNVEKWWDAFLDQYQIQKIYFSFEEKAPIHKGFKSRESDGEGFRFPDFCYVSEPNIIMDDPWFLDLIMQSS